MKPVELLEYLIGGACYQDRNIGPGQLVMKLPEEYRKILRELKSSDLENQRDDVFWATNGKKKRWYRGFSPAT